MKQEMTISTSSCGSLAIRDGRVGGRFRNIEQPDDFGFGSVPKSVDKEFTHYHNVKKM